MALTNRFVFIIGAHKAGTTSVAHWLDQHEGVTLARSKEPNVFRHRDVTDPGDPYWSEFGPEPLKVDASTNYSICSVYPAVPERIHRFCPEAKILYLTRDPLARIWSGWRQHLDESGYPIARDFESAVKQDRSLTDATLYNTQLLAYRRCFHDRQILTLPMETLVANRSTQEGLLGFLGITPVDIELAALNRGAGKKQDRFVVDYALGTNVGRRAADVLRASRFRHGLASIRRRALLKAIDLAAEEARSWRSVPTSDIIKADCRAYLQTIGVAPSIWPSLSVAENDMADDDPGDDFAGDLAPTGVEAAEVE